MPRQARLDAPGTLHHVIVRGMDGLDIFRNDRDRTNFLSRVALLIDKTQTRILAWALLDNHLHLLLLSGPSGMAQFMRRLLTGYAVEFNRKYRRRGHVFQDRYKSIVCEKETYLSELIRYIHLNPLRAGLVKTLEELDAYPWSGHAVLMGQRRQEWQEIDFVLGQFSEDRTRAVRAYRRFLEEGAHQGRRDDLVGGGLIRSYRGWSQVLSLRGNHKKLEHDARILGKEDFVKEVLKEADKKVRRQLQAGERQTLIDQSIQDFCTGEGINEQELRSGSQRKPVSLARAKISFQLNRDLGISMAEIARNVGVSTTAVVKAVQKLEGEVRNS